ncbi:MAG TPA: hypothetical protein VGE13_01600 [Candidatus Saccharimonadales bacterium]
MNLDYSALNQPVTKQDIDAYKQHLQSLEGKKKRTAPLIIYIIVGIFGFLYILNIFSHTSSGGVGTALAVIFFVGAFITPIVILSMRAQTKRRAKLHKFALQNNLTFRALASPAGYAGMIFDEGHSRQINESLLFPDGNEIGNLQYTVGGGKNQRTYHWAYARIKLTRRLPNMVLDAKKNNFFGKISNLPDGFSKDQTLSLEGDFNNYFTLYAPKQYESDALYVFTPDVMAAVIDAGQAYDMEVIDDNLMIYQSGTIALDSQTSLTKIISIIDKIGTELRDQSHRYADERVGDRKQNIVAMPGQRLKNNIKLSTIITLLAVIIYIAISILAAGNR